MKTWMRRCGDWVMITTGNYAGHKGTVEANVYQRTVDYFGEIANGTPVGTRHLAKGPHLT